MDEKPSKISSGAYEQKFGSWRKALLAFIERVNSKEKIPSESYSFPKKTILKTKAEKKKTLDIRSISISLRYRVLNRDNFKCVFCGDSPAMTFNCRLQVDHIKPFSQGGKTIEENLQTLCARCNQGKGSKG